MTARVKVTSVFVESATKNIIENDSGNYNTLFTIIKLIKRLSFIFSLIRELRF